MLLDLLNIVELAATIRSFSQACPRVLVDIDGPGGSGKGTLAAQLAEALGDTFLVHSDDIYLPSARETNAWTKLAPSSTREGSWNE